MPLWYRSILSAKEALVSANASLENARGAQDRGRALKYCKEAATTLRRIDTSAILTDQFALEQIIVTFREHGRVLVTLNESKKAQKSFNKAKELEDTAIPDTLVHSLTPVASRSPASVQSSIIPSRSSSPVSPPSTSASQQTLSSSTSNTIINQNSGQNSEITLATIFAKDSDPYAFEGRLPGPDKRLDNTRQLAYCLDLLLQDPVELDDTLDAETRTWLQATRENADEQERLTTMAKDLLREFTREELKDATAVAEVVCLAPVLDKQDFRFLLGQFVDNLSSSALLNTRALEGLDQVVQSAPPFSIDAYDLVKILEHLNSRLEDTHADSLDYIYRLTSVVSHVLDAMALGGVQGLDRVNLHTPLTVYLQKLIKSADPYLAFQAAYASQALLWIPNDEELWKTILRRTGTVTMGLVRLMSAAKRLNVDEFIDGLGNIQEGLEGAGQFFRLVTDAFKGVTELIESGQGLRKSLKEGLSFSRKQKWYPVLRAADTLLRDGELIKFKSLVCDAPCRKDVAFQWGVCQRLGYIAANLHWEPDTREGAVMFLGEIYRNDAAWGESVQIKKCITNILMQLSTESGFTVQPAESMLNDLRNDSDTANPAQSQAYSKEGSTPRPWQVIPPLLRSSPLLDRVQKKPLVKAALREFQRRRLQEQQQRNIVYIPPQAKASRERTDDELFDLTTKVHEFLAGDRKVLLIMGDSGAGKSTFNLELERELWDVYDKDKKRIPVFVTLPAINKPDHDLIAKHLRRYDFNKDQIQELKSHHKFVLICDGYDECQQEDNLYTSNRLNQPGEWNVQMVISCRSEYLGHDNRRRFQPGDRNDWTGGTLLQEVVIAPFSKCQIRHYIEKYVVKYTPSWKVKDYLRALHRIPGLQELVKNPFLLTLSLCVLPKMVNLGNNLSSIKVTRVALYDKFVEQWVDRGIARLHDKKLRGSDAMIFKDLCNDGFSYHAIRFLKDLAVAIFENQDGAPVVEYSPFRDRGKWQHTFFGQIDGNNLLCEACPIVRIGCSNQYRFIHHSVLEYGLARAVFEPQSGRRDEQSNVGSTISARQKTRMGPHPEAVQVRPATNDSAPDFTSPLCRRSFVNEPSILHFLAERVQQEPTFKQGLFAYIEQSKTGKRWSIAAANAITILVRARILFNGADLKGIQIPGADLSGGQFDSVQLQGADLSNVNLRNIWLRQANLSDARMEGVEFSEQPYLMEESSVRCCAYSPDGKACVFSHADGAICIYDSATWTKTNILLGHEGYVSCVVYSPNGQQIASGGKDMTVRLWDAQTGAPGLILSGCPDIVDSVAYSPSGRQIVSGGRDNTVRLWDAQTGESGLILRGHTDMVKSVAYSPSGNWIASGSRDKTVRLWNAHTGELDFILSGHTGHVTSVVYSPDGQQVASSSRDYTVRLWDFRTRAPGFVLRGHASSVESVAYSPCGRQIASGGFDRTVRLWDTDTGESGPTIGGHDRRVQSVVYSPNGRQIVSCSKDKTVRLWDVETCTQGPILSGHAEAVLSVVYSPNGQQIASSSRDRKIRLWNAQTGTPGPILRGHRGWVRSVVYSPDGHQIASGSGDMMVRLWDTETGAPGYILRGHTDYVASVAYSRDGQQIASGSGDRTVRLWDSQTGAPGPILSGHTKEVTSILYAFNGLQIASSSRDKTVRLWDAQTGASGPILSGHTDAVIVTTYSPDGQQIASGGDDMTVRLWDAQTGAAISVLRGFTSVVDSMAYSSSGRQIAIGSGDNTVWLWDMNSRRCVAVVDDFHGPIGSITWDPTPESTCFATGCFDGSVRMWRFIQEEDRYSVCLQWTTIHNSLVVSNISLQGVQGLSRTDMRLLEQRGAASKRIRSLNLYKASKKDASTRRSSRTENTI